MQKARKPIWDKWIRKELDQYYGIDPVRELLENDFDALMRRYHARVRRMVKRNQAPSLWPQSDRDAYELALCSILADLDTLKRGTR